MADTNKDFINNILNVWRNLTLGQKISCSFIIVFVATILLTLSFWAKQPNYDTLFSRLSPEDASSIVEQLKNNKVPYKLTNSGTQILIPQENVYETRLDLARQGMPSRGGVGFELFDKNGFGMTDFSQKINYQRALQGELTRTINQMEEVNHSRIHIVLPQESIFSDKEKPATASIVLKLRYGANLSQMQIQGIVHLVASSVEGLNPDNITIITTEGKVLSKPKDKDDFFSISQTQLEYQRLIETKLKNSIQSMLEEVLGSNKSVVRVTAEIDSDKIDRSSESYDGENPVIRSAQRSLESDGSSGEKGKESGKGQRKNETLNYEINKTIEHKIQTPGKINRLYVATFIDGKTEIIKDKDGQDTKKYTSRTSEEMDEIKKIIMKAMGYSASRGDEIEVVNMAFDNNNTPDQKDILDKEEKNIFWLSLSKNIGIALLGIVIFYFLFRSFSKSMKNFGMYSPQDFAQQKGIAANGTNYLSQAEQPTPPPDVLMNTISDFAKQSPESASKLISSWLDESRTKSRIR
ncbi:MAG: flagellar M-ring protein FliF [Candidatus Firestonebacteria bacterium]|nr:flagellar M-ring protein FliF [Candidatus Firestonebacteria bacterium]